MPDELPDLWGSDLNIDVLSPRMILNTQAERLRQRTQGILTAELIQRIRGRVIEIGFDIFSEVARHRFRVLIIRQVGDAVYPVWVTSKALYGIPPKPIPDIFDLDAEDQQFTRRADSQEDFTHFVGRVLQSSSVQVKIRSFLAKTNEAKSDLTNLRAEDLSPDMQQSEDTADGEEPDTDESQSAVG